MELTDQDRQLLKIFGILIPLVLVAAVFLPKVPVPGIGTAQGLKAIFEEKADQEKALKDIKKSVKEKEKKLEMMPQKLAQVEQLQKEVDYYESRLPTSDKLDDLLAELNTLARYSGQKFTRMKTLKPAKKTTHEELPLEINLETDFHGLGNFINMTENSDRFSKVDDFVIEGDEENPGQVNVEMTLSTFKFLQTIEEKSDDDEDAQE